MNERIRELAEQAGPNIVKEFDQEDIDFCKKFAELIVRECMDICYRTDTEYEGHKVKSTVITSKVAEHFRVEE
jgi:hypothetical protein